LIVFFGNNQYIQEDDNFSVVLSADMAKSSDHPANNPRFRSRRNDHDQTTTGTATEVLRGYQDSATARRVSEASQSNHRHADFQSAARQPTLKGHSRIVLRIRLPGSHSHDLSGSFQILELRGWWLRIQRIEMLKQVLCILNRQCETFARFGHLPS
jgi:hypothetical protein